MRVIKLLLLHAVLMLIVLLSMTVQRGGVVNLYGDNWLLIIVLLSVIGGAIAGGLLLQFVLFRPLAFTRQELIIYCELFFVLVGGFFQTLLFLEALFGQTSLLKYFIGFIIALLWLLGRQLAVHLLPPEKWQLTAKEERAETD